MQCFGKILEIHTALEAEAIIKRLGCDPVGVQIMKNKAVFRNILLEKVPTKGANLLKQTFLAKGGEVSLARGSADLSIEETDVLISATLKQYFQALAQLKSQPWGLPMIANCIEGLLSHAEALHRRDFEHNGMKFQIEQGKTLVMGILNITPDSFSDGGQFNDPQGALKRVMEMIEAGADIIDIGAESTRPYGNALPISADEELSRIIPVLEKILPNSTVPISIDTYKASVAEAGLNMGAHMINDVWGLQHDPSMAKVLSRYGVPVIIMHNRSCVLDNGDIISEIEEFFRRSITIGLEAGISIDSFILDPGIGFGKSCEQNLEILARLKELRSFGLPIMIGTSRKRFIGETLILPVEDRVEGTGSTIVHAILNGANIVRVHDVRQIARMVHMTDAIEERRQRYYGQD